MKWRAKGIRAEDGDTLVIKIDRGWFDDSVFDVRLGTIDTFEKNKGTEAQQALGIKARDFTNARIAGKWLQIVTRMDTEKYGRLLADVYYQTEAGYLRDLATALREAGFQKRVLSPGTRQRLAQWHNAILAQAPMLGVNRFEQPIIY